MRFLAAYKQFLVLRPVGFGDVPIVKCTGNCLVLPLMSDNEIIVIYHQQYLSLLAVSFHNKDHTKKFFKGFNIKFLHEMAWFLEVFANFFNPGILCGKPSEEVWRVHMVGNKVTLGFSLLSSTMPETMSKSYMLGKPFPYHLPFFFHLTFFAALRWIQAVNHVSLHELSHFISSRLDVNDSLSTNRLKMSVNNESYANFKPGTPLKGSGWGCTPLQQSHFQEWIRSGGPAIDINCVCLSLSAKTAADASSFQQRWQADLQQQLPRWTCALNDSWHFVT